MNCTAKGWQGATQPPAVADSSFAAFGSRDPKYCVSTQEDTVETQNIASLHRRTQLHWVRYGLTKRKGEA